MQTSARPYVIVVDDFRDGADTLVQILQFGGYETRAAYSMAEGLRLVQQRAPSALISEFATGSELAGALLAEVRLQNPAALLIAVTARPDLYPSPVASQFDCVLWKPADPSRLLRLLQSTAIGLHAIGGAADGSRTFHTPTNNRRPE